jgi:GTPase involved in cell partitioning and DNA repair
MKSVGEPQHRGYQDVVKQIDRVTHASDGGNRGVSNTQFITTLRKAATYRAKAKIGKATHTCVSLSVKSSGQPGNAAKSQRQLRAGFSFQSTR